MIVILSNKLTKEYHMERLEKYLNKAEGSVITVGTTIVNDMLGILDDSEEEIAKLQIAADILGYQFTVWEGNTSMMVTFRKHESKIDDALLAKYGKKDKVDTSSPEVDDEPMSEMEEGDLP
jgi:hypothetical protein